MVLRRAALVVLFVLAWAAHACKEDEAEEGCGLDTACAGVCVNLDVDVSNCGKCGTTCGGDQTCVSGHCIAKPSGSRDASVDASRD